MKRRMHPEQGECGVLNFLLKCYNTTTASQLLGFSGLYYVPGKKYYNGTPKYGKTNPFPP
jgi:hypothetical protein